MVTSKDFQFDSTGLPGGQAAPIPASRSSSASPAAPSSGTQRDVESLDQLLLHGVLQNIREAVLFVETRQKIVLWNHAAENLIGINGRVPGDLNWLFSHVQFSPRQGRLANANDINVRAAISGQVELMQHATMAVGDRPPTPVDVQVVPLRTQTGTFLGSLIVIHDASYKVNLQQQVQELMAKTISDPLTGVANRAEFERVLVTCCQHYRASNSDLSLIICDIDFFKRINDTYGHPIGDEALVTFASFLQRSIREADFLARFGGEEFVIVCNDCNGQSAVECAEKIRARLQNTQLPCLGQSSLTASFGVTQFCRDDTPSSFFARADQALLRAKEDGRNRVVLGDRHDRGTKFVSTARPSVGWLPTDEALVCQEFTSYSPMEVLAAKLEGFVQEHQAEFALVESNRVVIHTGEEAVGLFRRSNDRRTGFKIDLQSQEITGLAEGAGRFGRKTQLQITVSLLRPRDRRHTDVKQQAECVMRAMCGFLMLQTTDQSVSSSRPSGRE